MAEVERLGRTPEEALRDGFELSGSDCFTAVVEGKPFAMFGVVPFNEPGWPVGCAAPWFLATDDVRLVLRDLFVQTPDWLDYFNTIYPVLLNWVDSENEMAIRWLKRVGFKFVSLDPIGVGEHPFWRFVRTRDV